MPLSKSDSKPSLHIVYVLVCFNANTSGVYKKISDQIRQWRIHGHKVNIAVITDEESVDFWIKLDSNALILIDRDRFSKIQNRVKLVRSAELLSPDVIYLRDCFPALIPNVNSKVIIEIQSRFAEELKARSKFKYVIFQSIKKLFYRNVDAFIFVTPELARTTNLFNGTEISSTVISNGIDLERIKPLPLPPANIKPAILFIGHPNQSWHGSDQIVDLSQKLPEFDFHIIGSGGTSYFENVRFYPTLSETQYLKIASSCVVGIASLALYQNGMQQACPLKAREYLALGLPVIIRYEDVDFPDTVDFVLKVPSDGKPLSAHASEIREFTQKWSKTRVARDKLKSIDSRYKELDRLKFIMASHKEYKDFASLYARSEKN